MDTSIPKHHLLRLWLIVCCFMVYGAVIIGGATRLTDSGLSIVEWQPITGVLPPLSTEEWLNTFAAYQKIPEFQQVYPSMTLEEFKGIFWWEYIHRLWARLIGIIFIVPCSLFLWRYQLPRFIKGHFIGIAMLIGLQGLMGWLMVQSGLSQRTDVSHFRLAAHLGLALAIYCWLLWLVFKLSYMKSGSIQSENVQASYTGKRLAWICFILSCSTIISGALVAGLDAGFIYNTFPLMNGQIIPTEFYGTNNFLYVLFEEPAGIQWLHRLMAIITFCLTLTYVYKNYSIANKNIQYAILFCGFTVIFQVSVGIITLLAVAPLGLALLHQTGAVLVLSSWVWLLFVYYHQKGYKRSTKAAQDIAAT